MNQNRFFIIGDSGIKYSYNNGKIAEDPLLASLNFLNALERMHKMIEKYQSDTEKIAKDIPVFESTVNAVWKKEDELKELKAELLTLDRQIQLSLKPVEQGEKMPVIGRIEYTVYGSRENDYTDFTNVEDYISAIKKELRENSEGFNHITIPKDPELRKRVRDRPEARG